MKNKKKKKKSYLLFMLQENAFSVDSAHAFHLELRMWGEHSICTHTFSILWSLEKWRWKTWEKEFSLTFGTSFLSDLDSLFSFLHIIFKSVWLFCCNALLSSWYIKSSSVFIISYIFFFFFFQIHLYWWTQKYDKFSITVKWS